MHAANPEIGLHECALYHANRVGGDVVVMPARVVTGGPTDEPDVYVLVAADRGIVPLAPGVGNLIAPQVRAASQVLDEFSQFAPVEKPGGEHGERHCCHSSPARRADPAYDGWQLPCSSRVGFVARIAWRAAPPRPKSGYGSAYGRSEPNTSMSTPSTRSTESTARPP